MAGLNSAIPGGIRFLGLTQTPETEKKMAEVRPEYHMAVQKPAPHLAGIIGVTTPLEYALSLIHLS